MWNSKYTWTILSLFVLFIGVRGSCLEYGHSCWGGHGKRSNGAVQAAGSNLPSNLLELLMENGQKHNLALAALNELDAAAAVEETNASPMAAANRANNFLENQSQSQAAATKWNKNLRKRRYQTMQQRSRANNNHHNNDEYNSYNNNNKNNNSKNNNNNNKNNYLDNLNERWLKVPFFKYKYTTVEQEAQRDDANDDSSNFYEQQQ